MSVQKAKVVIVGGGYSGIAIAQALDGKCDLLVIERNSHFYHNIAAPRAAVDPEVSKKVFIPYDRALKKGGKFLHANIKEITKQAIILENDEQITFDYLVIALGSQQSWKTTNDNQLEIFKSSQDAIKAAQKILIVGAGPTGTELAGEIATYYPEKKVTLVGPALIPGASFPDKLRERLRDKLVNELKVQVILNEKVNLDAESEGKYTTDKGTAIEADYVIKCTGSSRNTQTLTKNFGDVLDATGHLKVTDTFQVQDSPNIFAIGDICNIQQEKTSIAGGDHAAVASHNILQLINGKTKLKEYKPPASPMIVVALGQRNGAGSLKGTIIGGFLTKTFKSKDLLTGRFTKQLNQ
eukprot:TRINITY_DN8502_c0_g1_i1.p1 TRINITY_DN8502_c0_g1~~TRINITY_DN8502_c0_g1_i1.p1  ORF type:complete len:353 (-),score=84.97 TRINITY_DN8502_c0_g1_i1:56-1114(-)